MINLFAIVQNFNNYTNLKLKTAKPEMYYSNYYNALWDCFGFHIAQIGNMLPNQVMLPDWAIGLDSDKGLGAICQIKCCFFND